MNQDNTTLKLCYEVLSKYPLGVDRHFLFRAVQELSENTVVQSSVSGRLCDLKRSGLVKSMGKVTGEQGKLVSLYTIDGVIR